MARGLLARRTAPAVNLIADDGPSQSPCTGYLRRVIGFRAPRLRRLFFVYNAANSLTNYARLNPGVGADGGLPDGITNAGLLLDLDAPYRLRSLAVNTTGTWGSTVVTLALSDSLTGYAVAATWAAQTIAAPGVHDLTLGTPASGSNLIAPGKLVTVGINPTGNHMYVAGYADFERL